MHGRRTRSSPASSAPRARNSPEGVGEGGRRGLSAAAGSTMPLPPASPSSGRVVLGIRPEHVRLDPDGELELRVDVIESLGRQKYVYGLLDAKVSFTIAVDPSLHLREGQVLRVTPRTEQMHLFDAGTGER